MLFQNNNIETENLPKFEEIQYKPIEKKYKILLLFNWGLLFLGLFLIIISVDVFFKIPIQPYWKICVYSLLALAAGWKLILVQLSFPLKGYHLREHDIIYRTGFFYRKIVAVPFNRVQHSEIRQGVVGRIFGVATLKIFTAGGLSADLSVNGLLPETAQKISDYLSKSVSNYE